jgi:plasmid stability protein
MLAMLSYAVILKADPLDARSAPVPSLSVRGIERDLYERLRIRAARNGVSMEEEVRRILQRAVAAPDRAGDLALECFGEQGVELELPARKPHEPVRIG